MGAVTFFVRDDPTDDILFPTFSSVLPAESILFRAVFASAASLARFLSSCSVATISRWSASYLSLPRSPFSICVFACSCAVFKASSFSLVAPIFVASASCFCVRRVVFDGSSFKSLSTSFNWLVVVFMVDESPESALEIPVVSPFMVTVSPDSLFAIYLPPF